MPLPTVTPSSRGEPKEIVVNSYTVAITCEGYNAQMILKIDDSSGTPRINELSIRPMDGVSLSARDLPNIDLELLLRSLQQPADASATTRAVDRSAGPAAGESPDDAVQLTSTAGRRQRPDASGPGQGRKESAMGTSPSAEAAQRQRRRARTTTIGTARIYRRMPDDLAEVYAQSGSVSAVARHYGVPRHTAQGWIGRLRRQA